MCWAWNLQEGWLRNLGYFDRGGCIIIFFSAGVSGAVGTIVAGPRYMRYLKKKERPKMKAANV